MDQYGLSFPYKKNLVFFSLFQSIYQHFLAKPQVLNKNRRKNRLHQAFLQRPALETTLPYLRYLVFSSKTISLRSY